MESVMGNEELVSLILGKLTRHRHLACCSAVSKLWLSCSAIARAALPIPDTLLVSLGRADQTGLWSINPVTGEQQPHAFPGCQYPDVYHAHKVLATCRGLVLLSVNKGENQIAIAVGNPLTGNWRILPPLDDFDVTGALLVRDEPSPGDIVLLVISDYGKVHRYDFRGGGHWVLLTSEFSDFSNFHNLVYHRQGVLATFHRFGQLKFLWYSLRSRRWSNVCSVEWRERNHPSFLSMHWEGRLMLIKEDRVFDVVVEVEEGGDLCTGGRVVEESMEEMIGLSRVPGRLVSADGEYVYWVCAEVVEVTRLCLRDKSVVTFRLDRPRKYDKFMCFTPDDDEVIRRFGPRCDYLLRGLRKRSRR